MASGSEPPRQPRGDASQSRCLGSCCTSSAGSLESKLGHLERKQQKELSLGGHPGSQAREEVEQMEPTEEKAAAAGEGADQGREGWRVQGGREK